MMSWYQRFPQWFLPLQSKASLLASMLPEKLVPKIPSNIQLNPTACSFFLFLVNLVTHFINIHEFLRDLTIFMMIFKSAFDVLMLWS